MNDLIYVETHRHLYLREILPQMKIVTAYLTTQAQRDEYRRMIVGGHVNGTTYTGAYTRVNKCGCAIGNMGLIVSELRPDDRVGRRQWLSDNFWLKHDTYETRDLENMVATINIGDTPETSEFSKAFLALFDQSCKEIPVAQ